MQLQHRPSEAREREAERTLVSDVGASQDAAGEAKASTLRRLETKPSLALVVAMSVLCSAGVARAEDEPGVEPKVDLRVSPRLHARHGAEAPAGRLRTSVQPDRSPGTAVLLALGSTLALSVAGIALMAASDDNPVAGFAVLGVGLAVGPSMGHFYAGEVGHGVLMSLGRGALMGLGVVSMVAAFLTTFDGKANDPGIYVGLAIGLAAAAGALAIYDFIDAPRAVHRRLARRRAAAVRSGLMSLRVTPMVGPTADGGKVVGLAGSMRF